MAYEDLLIKNCTIKQKTATQTDSGAKEFTWSNRATNVRTRRVKNREPKVYDELSKTYKDDYKFYFLLGQEIKVGDIIELDSNEYTVISVDVDSHDHHIKVFASKTTQ